MKRERRKSILREVTEKWYLHACPLVLAHLSFTNDALEKAVAHYNQNELLLELARSLGV